MAHDLEIKDGTASMAYVGTEGTPWHGLGQTIEKGAPVEVIAKAAKLDWPVLLADLGGKSQRGNDLDIKMKAMYRGDTDEVLDVVGPNYFPLQNLQVLRFFDEMVQTGDMFIDTAGFLKTGNVVWALAKITPSSVYLVGKDDPIEGYLLLSNPHKYGKGFTGKFVMTRVVCRNTWQMAMSEMTFGTANMSHGMEFDADRQQRFKEKLGLADKELTKELAWSKLLAETPIKEPNLRKIFTVASDGPGFDVKDEHQPRAFMRMLELYHGAGKGAKLSTASGTYWGAFNAVTQYVDWEKGRLQDNRVSNAWYGSGATIKRNVHTLIDELMAMRA